LTKQLTRKKASSLRYWRGLSTAYGYLRDLTDQVEEVDRSAAHRILAQVLVGTLTRMSVEDHEELDSRHPLWVPIPRKIRQRCGPSRLWDDLRHLGVIKRRRDSSGHWYDKDEGRCGEYALEVTHVEKYISLGFQEAFSSKPRWVNLLTGDPVGRAKVKTSARLVTCPASRPVRVPLVAMVQKAQQMLTTADAVGRIDLRLRALRAMSGVVELMSTHRVTRHRDGWATVRPQYREHENGRRYGLLGSLQTLPREIKQVILTTEGTQWKNYDMTASHVAALLRVAGQINSTWSHEGGPVSELVPIKDLKAIVEGGWAKYVENSGLPKALVKRTVLSLMNGARLTLGPSGPIRGYVSKAFQRSEERVVFRRLVTLLTPVKKAVDRVMHHLRLMVTGRWIKPDDLVASKSGIRHILVGIRDASDGVEVINATKGKLKVTTNDIDRLGQQTHGISHTSRVLASVMSHVLTGIERDFVWEVVDRLGALGIPFLDEHDGVAVWGELPAPVVEEAKRASVLANYANLKPKQFIDPEEDDYERIARAHGHARLAPDVRREPTSRKELSTRIEQALRSAPSRSNRDFARELGCCHKTIGRVRCQVERFASPDPILDPSHGTDPTCEVVASLARQVLPSSHADAAGGQGGRRQQVADA